MKVKHFKEAKWKVTIKLYRCKPIPNRNARRLTRSNHLLASRSTDARWGSVSNYHSRAENGGASQAEGSGPHTHSLSALLLSARASCKVGPIHIGEGSSTAYLSFHRCIISLYKNIAVLLSKKNCRRQVFKMEICVPMWLQCCWHYDLGIHAH